MAERVSGPYRGYFISAEAKLTHAPEKPAGHEEAPIYVGSVSLSLNSPDEVTRFEALVDLGEQKQRFASEADALDHVEAAARAYIDRLLQSP